MEARTTIIDQQVAVLIDFENVGLASVQWLFDQISDIGRIIVKRAYGDWSVARSKRDQLLELGIEPIHQFHSGAGKNSSDIRLAIDAVDLVHTSPVDTFVIVSSDTDFVPLISKLRAAGKSVIGAGRKATAARTLVISCDRYYYLEQDEQDARRRKPSAASRRPRTGTLLQRAMTATMDDQGRVVGGRLHQAMLRLDPSFDFRALGHSTFRKFLESSPEVKTTRPTGPGDVSVELVDSPVGPEQREVDPGEWGPNIDGAWSKRAREAGQSIAGPLAAADAARVLDVAKLSASPYPTLQNLLDSSEHLNTRWRRDKNKIIRK